MRRTLGRNSGRGSSRGVNSKEWTGAIYAATGITAGTAAAAWVIDPPTMIDDFESPTIIRLRIAIAAFQTTTVATASALYGFGLYVATGDEDTTTVPTEFWEPLGDHQSDWLYRWVAALPLASPANVLHANGGTESTVDVRSKRKVPRGAGLLAVSQVDYPGAAGTVTLNVAADIRALLISG